MLDVRTVAFLLVLTLGVAVVVHAVNWRMHPQMRGPGWWTAGGATLLCGALLVALRGRIPDLLSIVLANGCLVGAQVLMLRGSCAFAGTPMPWRWSLSALAVQLAGFAWFTYVDPSLRARWWLLGGASAWVLALNLWVMHRLWRTEGTLGVGLYAGSTTATLLLLLAIPAAQSVTGRESDRLFEADGVTALGLMLFAATVMLQTFGRLLMTANRTQRELTRLALVDALTGVANRRAFDEALDRSLAVARRSRAAVGLVLVDVDHFKTINDVHGHANGDIVLREVALRLAGFIRTTDFPARVGGEEFAVILHEPLPTSMREVAERVRRAVGSAPVRLGDRFVQVTVSIGVAAWPAKDVADRASLYEAADKALYAAKQAGRDRVVIAGQPLQDAA